MDWSGAKWTGWEKGDWRMSKHFCHGYSFLIHFWFLGGPTVNQRHSRVRHGLSKTRYFFSFQSACPRDKGKNMKSWNIIVNWNMFYRQAKKLRVQATFLWGFNVGGGGVRMDPTLLRLKNFQDVETETRWVWRKLRLWIIWRYIPQPIIQCIFFHLSSSL